MIAATPLTAHEFWIDPAAYQVPAGGTLRASFRNGENFRGTQLAYFARSSARFELAGPGEARTLTPRDGARPAVDLDTVAPGLAILVYETTPRRLTYSEWEKFAAFAAHKDFPDIAARHDARGLPRTGFRESYTRHAKALIGIGEAGGSDRPLGLATEFVAEANPYQSGLGDRLPVRLYHDGVPRADAQVEIFEEAGDGTVTIQLARTDAAGRADIPVRPGHRYLLDAVVLRVPEDSTEDDAWQTLWASLTFAVPVR